MGYTEFLIHPRIRLRVAQDFAWRDDWLQLCADLPRPVDSSPDAGRVTIEVNGSDGIDLRTAREISDGVYVSPGGVIDSVYGVAMEWGADRLKLNCTRPSLEWAMPLFLLAGLRVGCAFVHGAGLERDGAAWLFPSWGGVGKTALVATMVGKHGWRVLGDDFVIVDRDGTCSAFPKPMVLYPYHRSLFKDVFSSGRGPAAPVALNGALSRLAVTMKPMLRRFPGLLQWARRNNPQSVRVMPSAVFGRDKIGRPARTGGVVFLEREVGLADARLDEAAGGVAGRILGTTVSEFDPRTVTVLNIALGSGHLGLDQFYEPWVHILREALADKPQYVFRIPADWSVERLVGAVLDRLKPQFAGAGAGAGVA